MIDTNNKMIRIIMLTFTIFLVIFKARNKRTARISKVSIFAGEELIFTPYSDIFCIAEVAQPETLSPTTEKTC